MKIVLSGVETINKGAELMLYAILQEIERKFPDAIVYIQPDSIPQGFDYIETKLVLIDKPIAYVRRFARKFRLFSILKLFHISWIPFEDIYAIRDADFFLDDGGFSITDKWKITDYVLKIRELIYKRQSRQNTKIVFLPQAFGPFEMNNTKKNVLLLNKYATCVMAREEVSYNYLKESKLIAMDKVRMFPDFTSLVHGYLPEKYDFLRDAVCIIPNVRMLDMENLAYEDYFKFIQIICKETINAGFRPYLLNHEGTEDGKLARRFQTDLGIDIAIVDGLNALQIKGVISSARLVVTSRFHGVASALNSCVPCLATSWSHKYAELFKDYGQSDCVLSPTNLNNTSIKIRQYLTDDINAKVREQLKEIQPLMRAKAREMWDYVWALT